MDSNKQMRICNCWLDVGGCFCELNTIQNERKRTDSNEKSDKKSDGDATSNPKPDAKPERPLDWDARDLKTNAWLPRSSRSAEGGYTNRFWEED
jgi:hypothetical protein